MANPGGGIHYLSTMRFGGNVPPSKTAEPEPPVPPKPNPRLLSTYSVAYMPPKSHPEEVSPFSGFRGPAFNPPSPLVLPNDGRPGTSMSPARPGTSSGPVRPATSSSPTRPPPPKTPYPFPRNGGYPPAAVKPSTPQGSPSRGLPPPPYTETVTMPSNFAVSTAAAVASERLPGANGAMLAAYEGLKVLADEHRSLASLRQNVHHDLIVLAENNWHPR